MSEELIRAPIQFALKYDFPLLLIASRNQVSEDEGGGNQINKAHTYCLSKGGLFWIPY